MTISTPTSTVLSIGQLNFTGNIIPANWWHHITLPSGKPDSTAIVLLSDIVYWYRPVEVRDENTGALVGRRKRFHGDKLQRSYQAFADQFGFSKRETTDALKRLRDAGLVSLELRTVQTQTGVMLSNVLFVEPVPYRIGEITTNVETEQVLHSNVTPPTLKRNTPLRSDVTPPTLKRETYTEITTEITHTEISTDKPLGAQADAGTPAKPKKQASDYSDEFEHAWSEYPRREGSNPKNKAYQAWSARIREGVGADTMLAGLRRYAQFCKAKGQVGTSFVMQGARFFGPGQEFEADWKIQQSGFGGNRPPIGNFESQDYGESNCNW
ncbi:TPA: replication protein [Serratia fonticola]|nr:replication protein [Serratia fonticola]